MKKNKVRFQNFDKVLFIPKKQNFFYKHNKKIFLFIIMFFVFALFPLILNYFAPFPLDKIQFSSDTGVFCEDPIYPMGGDGIYDQEYFDLKTDFIGYVRNDHWLKAKNVKLGVKIQGISNPRSKWTMGTVVIDEIPPETTKKFNVRFNHDCAQADINWTYEVMEAYY